MRRKNIEFRLFYQKKAPQFMSIYSMLTVLLKKLRNCMDSVLTMLNCLTWASSRPLLRYAPQRRLMPSDK